MATRIMRDPIAGPMPGSLVRVLAADEEMKRRIPFDLSATSLSCLVGVEPARSTSATATT
jgi:hypothetical protein